MDRTIGAGPISAERALNYGFTGPNLRAAGVDYDVRVHTPYSSSVPCAALCLASARAGQIERYMFFRKILIPQSS